MPGTASSVALVTSHPGAPGSVLHEIDLGTRAEREVVRFDDTLDEVVFASDGHLWVRAASVVRVYDRDRRLLVSILRAADGGWLVVAPDRRYDWDGTGATLAAWRVEGRLESITSVPSSVRVPHLLAQVLGGR